MMFLDIVNYPNIITDHVKKLNSQLNDLLARKLSVTVPFIISCDQYEENEKIWLEKDQKSEDTFREVSENFHSNGGLTERLTTQCKYVQETESMINNNIINPMRNNYNKDNEKGYIDPLKLYSDLLKEEFSDVLLNESSGNSIAIKTEVDSEEDPLANIENYFSKQVVKNANNMRATKLARLPSITKLKSIAKNNISKNDLVLPYNLTPKFRILSSKKYLLPHTNDTHVKKPPKADEISQIWIEDKTVQVKRKTVKSVDETAQNIDGTVRRVHKIATARSVDKKVWNVYKIANNVDLTAGNVGKTEYKTVQKHDRLTPSRYMGNTNKYNELKVDKSSKFHREPMIDVKDGKIVIDCKQKYTKRKIVLNPYSIDSKTKRKSSKKFKEKVATHRSEISSKQPTPVMLKKSVIDTRIDNLNDNNINTEKNARSTTQGKFVRETNTINNHVTNPVRNTYNKKGSADPLKLCSYLVKEEFSDILLKPDEIRTEADIDEELLVTIKDYLSEEITENDNNMQDTVVESNTESIDQSKNNISKSDFAIQCNLEWDFRQLYSEIYSFPPTNDIPVKR
ncbi:hypothetical protein K1T71_000561 [Dendrolimus kikuchii]|uniref:Uncharacterized protein n=1 Tax=Dendrolimus kikuchii TaxID=765133 RepID=A0ACC1DKD2_9NEOP|nr:hypothetical protein K1T71_000561 [Dendrolimus kikuchii]